MTPKWYDTRTSKLSCFYVFKCRFLLQVNWEDPAVLVTANFMHHVDQGQQMQEAIFQINACFLDVPSTCKTSGSEDRIFFPTTLHDVSGSLSVYVLWTIYFQFSLALVCFS